MTKDEAIATLKKISSVLSTLKYPGSNLCGDMFVFLDVLRQTANACEEIANNFPAETCDPRGETCDPITGICDPPAKEKHPEIL